MVAEATINSARVASHRRQVKSFVKGSHAKDMEMAPCHAVCLDEVRVFWVILGLGDFPMPIFYTF